MPYVRSQYFVFRWSSWIAAQFHSLFSFRISLRTKLSCWIWWPVVSAMEKPGASQEMRILQARELQEEFAELAIEGALVEQTNSFG